MGLKSPTPEQAARVAEARQAVEAIPRPTSDLFTSEDERHKRRRSYRRQVKGAIDRVLGKAAPTPLEKLKTAWAKLDEGDRLAFRSWLESQP